MAAPPVPVEILMVDDEELDYQLFRRQMAKQRIANETHYARSGEEALSFLRDWHAQPRSNRLIVLMDVNMPGMGGIECIRAIRDDQQLRTTVVFVLTSSSLDEDILDAYELNVAGYLLKDHLGPAFVDAVNMLESYWRTVQLPPQAATGR